MTYPEPKRIYFSYKHVDKPWGGANNFIRTLSAHLGADADWKLVASAIEQVDIMFMNQLGLGPGSSRRRLRIGEVKQLQRLDRRKIVVRAVNLYRHAFRMGPRNLVYGALEDLATLRLLGMADHVVFQSAYQREVFARAGYRGSSDVVIHNGADDVFWNERSPAPDEISLRIVSATASPRSTKRHDLILAISKVANVRVQHFGAWPEGLPSGDIELMGNCDAQTMAEHYSRAHLFLHPAIKDPCPNAIFEAICSGLPVLYNPGVGSSREIVGRNGIALDENNLAGSVSEARDRFSELKQNVYESRSYYHIERATKAYADAFRNVAEAEA